MESLFNGRKVITNQILMQNNKLSFSSDKPQFCYDNVFAPIEAFGPISCQNAWKKFSLGALSHLKKVHFIGLSHGEASDFPYQVGDLLR